jgi:hypothetical protein
MQAAYPNNNMRALQEVTSGELLTKEAMRKKCIIYKKYAHT